MKRIKATNGYTVYQAGDRDVEKYGVEAGRFYVYFSSDIKDYGIENSYSEFEGLDTIEEALAYCCGNYAKAREIVESRTTCATFEEIAEVETQLDAGLIDSDGEFLDPAEDMDDDEPAPGPTVQAELIGKNTCERLARSLIDCTRRDFEDPRTQKEFEAWKRRREATP